MLTLQFKFAAFQVYLKSSDGLIVYGHDDNVQDVLRDDQFVLVASTKDRTDIPTPTLPAYNFENLYPSQR